MFFDNPSCWIIELVLRIEFLRNFWEGNEFEYKLGGFEDKNQQ